MNNEGTTVVSWSYLRIGPSYSEENYLSYSENGAGGTYRFALLYFGSLLFIVTAEYF